MVIIRREEKKMESSLTATFIQTGEYQLHTVQAGDPSGRLVIMLHGFPEFWYGWRKQIDPLVNAGFRLLIPDQRGYNLSDRPQQVCAYTVDELSQDVLALIEWAGAEEAAVVGHDWGGNLVWHLALNYPERIRRAAILNAPHPLVFQKNLASNPRQVMRSLYAAYFQIPWLPEAMMRNDDMKMVAAALEKSSRPGAFLPEDLELYRQAWWREGAFTAMLNWYRALVRYRPPLPEDPRVKIPVQIIWGAKDFALGVEMVQPSLDLCTDGRLLLLEEATHWVQHEEAERVNEALIGFLRQ
jgi:epoxide hydrolase 4